MDFARIFLFFSWYISGDAVPDGGCMWLFELLNSFPRLQNLVKGSCWRWREGGFGGGASVILDYLCVLRVCVCEIRDSTTCLERCSSAFDPYWRDPAKSGFRTSWPPPLVFSGSASTWHAAWFLFFFCCFFFLFRNSMHLFVAWPPAQL